MMKRGFLFLCALGAAEIASAANSGSCESAALTLPVGSEGSSVTINWVKEYNPDTGKYSFPETWVDEHGKTNTRERVRWVCYYKQTLKRLTTYTAWLTDHQQKGLSIAEAYPRDSDDIETTGSSALFDEVRVGDDPFGEPNYYQYLPKGNWTYEPEFPEFNDPATWTYYFVVRYSDDLPPSEDPPKPLSGTKIHLASSNRLPRGIYENPVVLSATTGEQHFSAKEEPDNPHFYANEFFFGFALKKDRKYVFQSTGGTPKYPISAIVDAVGGITNSYPAVSEFDSAMTFVPVVDDEDTEKGRSRILLGCSNNVEGVDFGLNYWVYPARTVAAHDPRPIELGEAGVEIKPGRLSNSMDPAKTPEQGYGSYDAVIDEGLRSFPVKRGRRYALDTAGAKTNLLMRVYDADGNTLYENTGNGYGFDCRIVFESSADGELYVGVCQNLKDGDYDVPTYEPVRLTLTAADPQKGVPDEWDFADDDCTGASALDTVPVTDPNTSAERDDDLRPDKETYVKQYHRLGKSDWADCFMLAARKGVTYRLTTTIDSEDRPPRLENQLSAELYRLSGSSLIPVRATGSLGADIATNQFQFTASVNATYYLVLSVRDGVGFDYPRYRVHAIGFTEDRQQLAQLTVNMRGTASAAFSIDNESVKYKSGATLLLPAVNTPYKIKYAKVTGFAEPPQESILVGKGRRVYNSNGTYTDKFDHKDDFPSGKGTFGGKSITYGATSWSLKNTETVQARTLWWNAGKPDECDPADNFQFDGKDGCYFDFALKNVNGDETFGPLFSISNAESGVFANGVDLVHQLKLPKTKAKYILTVYQGAETADGGSYAIGGIMANVGFLKFAKSEVSFKENAGYAKVVVKRTQKDGRVRIRYETIDGTAKDGVDYIAKRGELEWANGDGKDKTISVKLIPDLVPSYEGKDPKTFRVRIWVLKDGERDYDEYPIMIQRNDKAKTEVEEDFATVTLTEVSKAAPGTVAIEGFQDGDAPETVVTTPKKPVVTVTAGNVLKLRIARQDGCNGPVGVKVAAKKGKAVGGVDFTFDEKSWTWADGEGEDQYIEIPTRKFADTKSFVESKTFTLSFSKTSGSPKFAASSVTVTIVSEFMAETLEKYAKSLPKAGGISVKAAKSGTWCRRANMSLEGAALAAGVSTELTWTLTGPGLFRIQPQFASGSGRIEYLVGKGKEYAELTPGDPLKALVEAGSQTVKVKFTAESEGAVPRIARSDEDGAPYRWLSLANLKPTPAVKSFIVGDGSEKFSWAVSPFCKDEGVRYRVCLAEKAGDLGKDGTILETGLTDPETKGGVTLTQGKSKVWRVDFSLDGENWVVSKTTWAVTAAASGAPVRPGISGKDAYGHDVSGGDVIRLVQGLKANFLPSGEKGTTFALANGKLPDGLKLATDKKTGITAISGVPTKAGSYSVVLQPTASKVKGVTRTFDFEVEAIDYAIGTFNGILVEDKESSVGLTNGFPSVASLVLTATAAGKLSGKVALGGKTYAFSQTGFDALTNGAPGAAFEKSLRAEIPLVQKIANVSYTNWLSVTVGHDAVDARSLSCVAGAARLEMAVPDANGKGVQPGIVYAAELFRDNLKSKDYQATLAASGFAGYYTVSLPTEDGGESGKPRGNGYVTVTVNEKTGKCAVAGQLADGTKVSSSFAPALIGEGAGRELVVPVFQAKSPAVIGGCLRFRIRTDAFAYACPVAKPESVLLWKNDDAKSTYYLNGGWAYELIPSGGWYDTVFNLQAYYFSKGFAEFQVDAGMTDELPQELLPAGKEFVSATFPTGDPVDLVGDALAVEKQVLVKDSATKLYSWGDSVNASKLALTFKRATGLVSGSFGVWTEGPNSKGALEQKFVSGAKFAGVLLSVRDPNSPFADDVWAPGYLNWQINAPYEDAKGKTVSRKWNYSAPFNIEVVPVK